MHKPLLFFKIFCGELLKLKSAQRDKRKFRKDFLQQGMVPQSAVTVATYSHVATPLLTPQHFPCKGDGVIIGALSVLCQCARMHVTLASCSVWML